MAHNHANTLQRLAALPALALRAGLGGAMMGLANLIPGISGATMLLATGIYPRFVAAIAEVTTFRFRRSSLFVLATVVGSALLTILFLAGLVRNLIVEDRWMMYSLFIGLTLGGVSVIWNMIARRTPGVWAGAAVGLLVMVVIVLAQTFGLGTTSTGGQDFAWMLLAGFAGACAMILPGISGAYLLLVFGVYEPILAAIDALRDALADADLPALVQLGLTVVLPVGLGVVVGVAGVSHVFKWLLARYESPTLGLLLGFLVGAVLGLWPFQEGVQPEAGDVVRGQEMTPQTIANLKPEEYPTVFFQPSLGQVAIALALIGLGFAITCLIARLGKEKPAATPEAETPA